MVENHTKKNTPLQSSRKGIALGYYHRCVLIDNASVKCWGRNNYGQLGIDNSTWMGDDPGDMAVLPSIDL